MILIVESGATKAEWLLKDGDCISRFRSPGVNTSVMSPKAIADIVGGVAEEIGGKAAEVTGIRYYGAGLVGGDGLILLDRILKAAFPSAQIVYGSDLLAAAKAGLGDTAGIVAILGTGSNSAFYDGRRIVANVRPGGFILGDEGGGAALGKAFVADFIKGLLPEDLSEKFRERFALTYENIVKNVYRGTNPAGYLASFVPFIIENRGYACVEKMIRGNFKDFIRRSLMQYDVGKYPVAVIGSFGYVCREELQATGVENGVNFCKFVPAPVEALAELEK